MKNEVDDSKEQPKKKYRNDDDDDEEEMRSDDRRLSWFLSHQQKIWGDACKSIRLELLGRKLNVECWVDMDQEKVTKQAMILGVRTSDVYVLFLSLDLEESWFVLLELSTALKYGKPIALVAHSDTGHSAFVDDVPGLIEKMRTKMDLDQELRVEGVTDSSQSVSSKNFRRPNRVPRSCVRGKT